MSTLKMCAQPSLFFAEDGGRTRPRSSVHSLRVSGDRVQVSIAASPETPRRQVLVPCCCWPVVSCRMRGSRKFPYCSKCSGSGCSTSCPCPVICSSYGWPAVPDESRTRQVAWCHLAPPLLFYCCHVPACRQQVLLPLSGRLLDSPECGSQYGANTTFCCRSVCLCTSYEQ